MTARDGPGGLRPGPSVAGPPYGAGMGAHEDAEIERRSRAMVEAQRPVRYWQRATSAAAVAARVHDLERRLAAVEHRLEILPGGGATPGLG